jgi:uncharacterized protein YneF (UPF0154 family)
VIAVWLVLAIVAGLVCGYVLGCRQMPRMIARMSPEQVDQLGAEVAKVKGLDDGTG